MAYIDKIQVGGTNYDLQDTALGNRVGVLEPAATSSDVGKALIVKTVSGGKAASYEFGEAGGGVDPSVIEEAVDEWLNEHPEATTTVEDGSITRVKIADGVLNYVTPEMFGAVGDGVTDDSQAVQDACDAGDDVYFASGKTYYLASTVTINHDCRLHGGENTVIKTQSVTSGGTTTLIDAFVASGTLKKTTTITTDYIEHGDTDNSGNRFTLSDMTGINVGDLLEIIATDQYYSYGRQYYYLGGLMQVSDIDNSHIYTSTSMVFDIEKTANVTAKIYDAPQVTVENLTFISDRAQVGFQYFVEFEYCKNSTLRNCKMTMMWNGVRFYHCYNSLIDSMIFSQSKADNSLSNDSYGVTIESSTNTTIERIHGVTSQACVDLSGNIPSMNTFIRNCNASGECRAIGLDMHENTYNVVIEDCDLGGLSLFGTAKVRRCRIYQNNRLGGDFGISVRGSHNARYARFIIEDCEFFEQGSNGTSYIAVSRQYPQNPIQSYNNIIGELIIRNCYKGSLMANMSSSPSTILSNVVERMVIDNWRDCYEFYHDSCTFEHIEIKDSTFVKGDWINKHTDGVNFDDIHFMRVTSSNPMVNRLYVDNTGNGGKYAIPAGVTITLSSNDTTAHYTTCGKNLMPNDPGDISVGGVSGSTGGTATRTVDSNFSTALSVSGGHLVYTQPNNTTKHDIYMKAYVYATENGVANMSCVLKNTGETEGATFKSYMLILDSATGNIVYRNALNTATATVQGASLTGRRSVSKGQMVCFYLYCSTAVENSVTKFEDFMASITPVGMPEPAFESYNGAARDGDGTMASVGGLNNIASSAASFRAVFKADLLENDWNDNARGVSF